MLFGRDCSRSDTCATFEAGEEHSNWGSTFTGGQIVTGFLDPSLGGANAGGGASDGQSFSRSFKNNTVGLDVKSDYSMSMYVKVNSFDGPSGGDFEIVDGSFGTGNAANLRVLTEQVSPGVFQFHWQARDNNTGWQDMGIDMNLGDPFRITINVHPGTFTYDATVESVSTTGDLLDWATLSGLAFDQNVINNGQNGNLLFFIQASAGGANVLVDNINISGTPEPGRTSLIALGLAAMLWKRSRDPGGSCSLLKPSPTGTTALLSCILY